MGGAAYASRGIALLALIALTVLPTDAAGLDESAKTRHFFPLIADGDGFRSHLFVTSVSGAANRCTLALRGPGLDAQVFQAHSAVSPFGGVATIDLGESGGSVTLASTGGQGLVFGYAKLDCDEPATARMLLSLQSSGTLLSMTVLESAMPGASFQFPVLPRLGRLAMVFSNEADLDAACAVELEGETGASLGGGNVTVPAGSTALQFLDELIPIPGGLEAGKARVSCDRNVAALGLPLNGPIFTGLPAVSLDGDEADSSHILPLIQDGGGFRSQLLLTNLAESGNQCAIDLHGGLDAGRFEIPAGAAATGSSVMVNFAAGGDQVSLFSTGEQALAYGYAAVACDGPVDARNLLSVDAAGNPGGMALVSSAQSADSMEFPVVPGVDRLMLAINNDAASEVSCAAELKTNGAVVASGTGLIRIAGHTTSVRFLGDLFAVPDDFQGGMAKLICYNEVSAASLLVSDSIFAAMPPTIRNDTPDTAAGNILEHHAALTAGLPARPFVNTTIGGTEGSTETVGTLRLGLNPHVFPVIVGSGQTGALVAASHLGAGRAVAFSGQDFLSPVLRATLLGNASAVRLLANAVRWAGANRSEPLKVLVDNQRVADALHAQGIEGVEVVGSRGPYAYDWSAEALADVDVAVVLANEWGTLHLHEDSVAPLRAFAERGGGLVVAASALHWSWWLESRHGSLTANLLLRGTGISWKEDSIDEIVTATTTADLRHRPAHVFEEYIGGGSLDAAQIALLPAVMHDALELGRAGDVNQALARLVRETPALPVSSTVPEARLAAEVAETLGPHEWPEIHPWAAVFPGLPAGDAPRIDGAVTVDASRSEFPADATRRERHLPLGFYAPPGALVTIEVPTGHATGDLRVSVGELHDDLGKGNAAQPMWRRAPWLRREFAVTDRRTRVTNAYGGSIALVVPADYERGRVQVTVRGAIPMAVYTDGESSAAEWFADLDAGAPQAIIQTMGGIRLVISTENARGVDDPGEVAAFWDGFNRHHAELSGEPAPRAFESIWIFDPQVGLGYANAGPVRINYPLYGEHWVLAPGTAEGRTWLATLPNTGPTPYTFPLPREYSPAAHGVDWWLFGHELGHQWQTEDWTGHGITEVGVNLFTMYTLTRYVLGGDDYDVYANQKTHDCAAPLNHAALANQRWSTAGNCEKLALYRQLIAEFGWSAMKAVFRSYYDPAYPRSTYGGSLDGFAIRFSAIAQRDLVGFFQHWEYPLSESAATTIHGFGHEPWLPPGW